MTKPLFSKKPLYRHFISRSAAVGMAMRSPAANGCNTLEEVIVSATGKWYFRTRATTDSMRVPVIQRGYRRVGMRMRNTAWCGLCDSCVSMAVSDIKRCHT